MNSPDLRPILCGTDFSAPARAAADAAVALAARLGAPLHLVHASVIVASPLTEQQLEEEASRLREAGAAVTAELHEGSADEVLGHLAEERKALMIIVSSVGRRAPARWLLGSVAERTAAFSPVPMLVVRDAAPFQAWAWGGRALKVFVGVDFTASSEAALRWVAALRKYGPCEVTAGFADWTPQEATRLGAPGPIGLGGNPPLVQSILERDMKAKVGAVLGQDQVKIVVQGGWGRCDSQLVGMAAEAQADLIITGTHRRQGFNWLAGGSISRGILRRAPMSVACVPLSQGELLSVPRIREIQRVLVAVDLDQSHGFAAPYAYGICGSGGTVRLVHVVAPVNLSLSGYYQEVPGEEERAAQAALAADRLRAMAPGEAAARGIRTEVEVIESADIARDLCAMAERFNADAICIGSHTRPGFAAKALGSVSLAVLQQSRRPVLIVWPPME